MCAFFCLVGALALAVGCGGGGGSGDADSGDGDDGDDGSSLVELGTGMTAFEPLDDETELVLWAGPQGGHHFIAHARITGMDPGDPMQPGLASNPSTRFSVADEDGARIELEVAPYRLGYVEQDGAHVLPSGRIVQVREAVVPLLYGNRARIEVEVTDAEGRSARDGRWVVAVEAAAGPAR
jgi:hypothetical protein